MLKGGYQILDFKNEIINMTEQGGYGAIIERDLAKEIADILNTTKKQILVTGLNIGGREIREQFVKVYEGDIDINLNPYDAIVKPGFTFFVASHREEYDSSMASVDYCVQVRADGTQILINQQ